MKIFYNYVFKSFILLFISSNIYTVFSMDSDPRDKGSLWQRQPHQDEFVDYDSEGSSDDELLKPTSESVMSSSLRKSSKSESSCEDDYAETVLANLVRHEEQVKAKKKSGFYKYLNKHLSDKTNGYDLCLMSQMPKTKKPEMGKIYLEKGDGQLSYTVLSPTDNVVHGTLPINFDGELTQNILRKLKSNILVETSMRGHTISKEINISDLSYDQKIENIDFIIKKSIQSNTLMLQSVVSDINNPILKNKTEYAFENTDKICEIFKDDLNSLSQILSMHNKVLIEVGLGYYAHKFFRLYYDTCKPVNEDIEKKIKGDTWEIWQWKYKIFKTNMKCFLLQFDSDNLSRHKDNIRKKAESSLLNYFKDSCRHLSVLYKTRSGFRAALNQKGAIGSGTKICFNELINNYLLDFPFLKNKAQVEKRIFEIRQKYEKEMLDFDKEVEKNGIMKTVLGEAPTVAANVGSRVLSTAWVEGGNLISNAGAYLSTYYNSTQQIQPQTQQQAQAGTSEPQGASSNTTLEPRKGWFW